MADTDTSKGARSAASITDLAGTDTTLYSTCFLEDYPGNGLRAGWFEYRTDFDQAVIDGDPYNAIYVRSTFNNPTNKKKLWRRIIKGVEYDLSWWGCVGDRDGGTTNENDRINQALNMIHLRGGGTLRLRYLYFVSSLKAFDTVSLIGDVSCHTGFQQADDSVGPVLALLPFTLVSGPVLQQQILRDFFISGRNVGMVKFDGSTMTVSSAADTIAVIGTSEKPAPDATKILPGFLIEGIGIPDRTFVRQYNRTTGTSGAGSTITLMNANGNAVNATAANLERTHLIARRAVTAQATINAANLKELNVTLSDTNYSVGMRCFGSRINDWVRIESVAPDGAGGTKITLDLPADSAGTFTFTAYVKNEGILAVEAPDTTPVDPDEQNPRYGQIEATNIHIANASGTGFAARPRRHQLHINFSKIDACGGGGLYVSACNDCYFVRTSAGSCWEEAIKLVSMATPRWSGEAWMTYLNDRYSEINIRGVREFILSDADVNGSILISGPGIDVEPAPLGTLSNINFKYVKANTLAGYQPRSSYLTVDGNYVDVIGGGFKGDSDSHYRPKYVAQTLNQGRIHIQGVAWSDDITQNYCPYLVGITDATSSVVTDQMNTVTGEVNGRRRSILDYVGLVDSNKRWTAAFNAALSVPGELYIPAGTYLTGPFSVTAAARVIAAPSAVIKRDVPSASGTFLVRFTQGLADGASWEGGVIDGAQSATSSTAYATNSGGAAAAGFLTGEFSVQAQGVSVRNLTISNSVNVGFDAWAAHGGEFENISTSNCASNQISNSKNIFARGLSASSASNNTVRIEVKPWAFVTLRDSTIDGVRISHTLGDASVYTSVPTATTKIVMGAFFYDLSDCTIRDVDVYDMATQVVGHEAITVNGAYECQFQDINVVGFAGTGVSLNGCNSTVFTDFAIDARWMRTTYSAADTSRENIGLLVSGGEGYAVPFDTPVANRPLLPADGTRRRRETSSCQDLVVSRGWTSRCDVGVNLKSAKTRIQDVDASSSKVIGFRIESNLSTAVAYSTATVLAAPDNVDIVNCRAFYCGQSGVSLRGGDNIHVKGGEFSSNGWDTTSADTLRCGIGNAGLSTVPTYRVVITGEPYTEDRQGASYPGIISFKPAAATAGWPENATLNTVTVTCFDKRRIGLSQQIILTASGASGADVAGQIIDISRDEVVIAVAAGTSLQSNGTNTVSLDGTWSLDPTDPTGTLLMAAAGTTPPAAATAQVYPGMWVKNGSEYRQVMRVMSATSFSIDQAFTGAIGALTRVSVTLKTTATQKYGLYLDSKVSEAVIGQMGPASGNLIAARLVDAGANKVAAPSVSGAASGTWTMVDDAIIAIAPPGNTGVYVVTDGVSITATILYRAAASPICVPSVVIPLLDTMAGVLNAANPGTDGHLTVSAAVNGKIYISNRLGATRSISIFFTSTVQ